jgi:hypothetical protein
MICANNYVNEQTSQASSHSYLHSLTTQLQVEQFLSDKMNSELRKEYLLWDVCVISYAL